MDYYYRTREQFQQLIENDQVVEHNFYNGNYYGTLREEVDKRLAARKVVVLVIDVHGAANIRRMFPGATTVFLLPPSVEELERRLRGRGTETEDSIQERLATARQELAQRLELSAWADYPLYLPNPKPLCLLAIPAAQLREEMYG